MQDYERGLSKVRDSSVPDCRNFHTATAVTASSTTAEIASQYGASQAASEITSRLSSIERNPARLPCCKAQRTLRIRNLKQQWHNHSNVVLLTTLHEIAKSPRCGPISPNDRNGPSLQPNLSRLDLEHPGIVGDITGFMAKSGQDAY